MSRTDKTAPYDVKMLWIPREKHDHRFGECNLPDAPSPEREPWSVRYANCYWDTNWYDPIYRCGCGMCGYDNRRAARASRLKAKAAIRAGRWDDLAKYEGPSSHWCY